MKHLVSILLLVFLFTSCKEEQQAPKPEPPVAEEEELIKTDTVKSPLADFEIKLLDSGVVEIVNKSVNANYFEWSMFGGTFMFQGTPLYMEQPGRFIFETNGTKSIRLVAEHAYKPGVPSLKDQKVIEFEVKTARGIPNAVFEGNCLGKEGTIEVPNLNTFNVTWGAVGLWNVACNYFRGDSLRTIFMAHVDVTHKTPEERYRIMKEYFEVGRNLVGKGVLQFGKKPLFSNKLIKDFPNAIYEVLKVEEFDQPKLVPTMYEKGLWVTFRIKVDGGDGDIIDGTLRARYLIY